MDDNRLMFLARFAAVVVGLAEDTADGGASEAMLYLFCNADMDDYQIMRRVLVESGVATISGNYVKLTESGFQTAARIRSEMVAMATASTVTAGSVN